MGNPNNKLLNWVFEEESLGAPSGFRAVLSSVSPEGDPHARVVAIREINDESLVFFTQKPSRKYQELLNNPRISLTFWFEMKQREVMIDGHIEILKKEENQSYWDGMPKERQIYFTSYSPTSGQEISSAQIISNNNISLQEQYSDSIVPLSENYRGFRVIPERYVFYTLFDDKVSEIYEFTQSADAWKVKLLSP